MKDFKIRIADCPSFINAQRMLFMMGCRWLDSGQVIHEKPRVSKSDLLVRDGEMLYVSRSEYFAKLESFEWFENQFMDHMFTKHMKMLSEEEPTKTQKSQNETMTVKVKPKGSTVPIYYENVISYFIEEGTVVFLFENGKARSHPFIHIWYWEIVPAREEVVTPNEINKNN